ncbi:TapY2 family type IVa secretion system protein [Colwellia sp. RSH04]|uniref:TapY2 family type IVa secretion system protein n=1 Tax=Colwellia sp. RSH04 TaxID=2305464 RepID=UPI000E586354|nr:TapY2 family type IVa secretion system protein [Colwellia sp. RSH04]RHW75555.1 hypothetical protein D1094_12610 [Colwellia sp. RSH04]
MFNLKKLGLVALMIGSLIATPLIAQDYSLSKGQKKERVTYKCFVEYSGGIGYDIRQVTGNFHKAKQASQSLYHYSHKNGVDKANKPIHKVFECVKENERFKNLKANNFDKNLPR